MHDALRRLVESRQDRLDLATAVAIAVASAVQLAVDPASSAALTWAIAAVAAFGAVAVALRRRYPLALSVIAAVVFFVPGAVLGNRWSGPLPDGLLLVLVILAYTVGSTVDGIPSVVGLIAVSLAASTGQISQSIASMWVFTVPAWVAGRVMRSRNSLTAALAARAEELEREREAYAREAVRYERARIARDLHDVVAHSVSTIVVQAGAGRRALSSDPAVAAQSLTYIQDSAKQAEVEIEQLVELLGDREPARVPGNLWMLDELVRRAAAAGLSVTYRFSGSGTGQRLSPALADAAYRVTQEGITNALKHAPGAPIDVHVHDGASGELTVMVANGPSGDAESGLEQAGGGYGLAGLRDRLGSIGGSLSAGPTAGGGWRLEAHVPRPARAHDAGLG